MISYRGQRYQDYQEFEKARGERNANSVDERMVGGTHYTSMSVQPWNVVDSWSNDQRIGFYKGNALKYLMRAGTKGSAVEDIDKAIHYLDKLKAVLSNA